MSDELKPCPFCGWGAESQMRTGSIVCCGCGASTPRWQDWNTRTDTIPSAAYVAGLEDALGAMLGRHILYCGGSGDSDFLPYAGHTDIALLKQARAAISAKPQAAPVRGDAELLYSAWLGLRVLENIAKVKKLSGAADVTTPLLSEIETAHPEFAPRSALRAII